MTEEKIRVSNVRRQIIFEFRYWVEIKKEKKEKDRSINFLKESQKEGVSESD